MESTEKKGLQDCAVGGWWTEMPAVSVVSVVLCALCDRFACFAFFRPDHSSAASLAA
jgi:hypothetical protein